MAWICDGRPDLALSLDDILRGAKLTPDPGMRWTVTLGLDIPAKMVRRCSEPMLAAFLARRLGEAFRGMPASFIVDSAKKLKTDYANRGVPPVLAADGKPFRI